MLIDPMGDVEADLEDKESMMVVEIDKKRVSQARRLWGFSRQLKKRV